MNNAVREPFLSPNRAKYEISVQICRQNRARLSLSKFLSLSDYAIFIVDKSIGMTVGTDRHLTGDDGFAAGTNFVFPGIPDDFVCPTGALDEGFIR